MLSNADQAESNQLPVCLVLFGVDLSLSSVAWRSIAELLGMQLTEDAMEVVLQLLASGVNAEALAAAIEEMLCA